MQGLPMLTALAQVPLEAPAVLGRQKWLLLQGSGKPGVQGKPSLMPMQIFSCFSQLPEAHSPGRLQPSPCF